jgi:hypothetical protein
MLFHSFKYFIRLNNVRVRFNMIICTIYILILLQKIGAFSSNNLRKYAMGI